MFGVLKRSVRFAEWFCVSVCLCLRGAKVLVHSRWIVRAKITHGTFAKKIRVIWIHLFACRSLSVEGRFGLGRCEIVLVGLCVCWFLRTHGGGTDFRAFVLDQCASSQKKNRNTNCRYVNKLSASIRARAKKKPITYSCHVCCTLVVVYNIVEITLYGTVMLMGVI